MTVRRHLLASGSTQGVVRATGGPRRRYGGNTGGRMAVLETVWWEYWRKHGGTRDSMVGVLGEAWR